MYCYVDPVKYIAYNPSYKLIHLKTIPDGDEYCEFTISPTSQDDRKVFDSRRKVYDLLVNIDKKAKV